MMAMNLHTREVEDVICQAIRELPNNLLIKLSRRLTGVCS